MWQGIYCFTWFCDASMYSLGDGTALYLSITKDTVKHRTDLKPKTRENQKTRGGLGRIKVLRRFNWKTRQESNPGDQSEKANLTRQGAGQEGKQKKRSWKLGQMFPCSYLMLWHAHFKTLFNFSQILPNIMPCLPVPFCWGICHYTEAT